MCVLVGKLKEHNFGVQNCSEDMYYCWTDHIVQHFRKQLYAASERKEEKPVYVQYSRGSAQDQFIHVT